MWPLIKGYVGYALKRNRLSSFFFINLLCFTFLFLFFLFVFIVSFENFSHFPLPVHYRSLSCQALRSFPEASFPTLQFISKPHNVHIRDVISIILSHWLVDCCLTSIEFKMYRYILFDVSYNVISLDFIILLIC